MNNKLEQYNKMEWFFKDEKTELEKLNDDQLAKVLKFVKLNWRLSYNNYSAEQWQIAIEYIQKQREYANIKIVSEIIYRRKRRKIEKKVETLVNNIQNSLNKQFKNYSSC